MCVCLCAYTAEFEYIYIFIYDGILKNESMVEHEHEHDYHVWKLLKFLSGLIEMFSTRKFLCCFFSSFSPSWNIIGKVSVNQAPEVWKTENLCPKWIINVTVKLWWLANWNLMHLILCSSSLNCKRFSSFVMHVNTRYTLMPSRFSFVSLSFSYTSFFRSSEQKFSLHMSAFLLQIYFHTFFRWWISTHNLNFIKEWFIRYYSPRKTRTVILYAWSVGHTRTHILTVRPRENFPRETKDQIGFSICILVFIDFATVWHCCFFLQETQRREKKPFVYANF